MDSMASSFLHNFSGQLLSRMISFGINMYLLRRIDSDILGLVNVNLMLFYSTTIFLVREPFRKVFLANEIPLSIIVTHLWFEPIIYPLIAALLYLCVWLPFSIIPDTSLVPSYIAALSMFAFSAWLESFAEPYVILSLRFGMDAQYAFAQSFLVIAQRVFAFILIIGVPMSPVYAFCCAQILSSFCYTALCIYLLVSGIRSVVPHVRDFNMISLYPSFPKVFSKENRSLLGAFTIHSIFKQAITNGTGYVLAFTNFFSLSDQAVFDAVDKLGSLVARIIFAPLEHSAYLYFSTCLRRATSAKDQIEINVKKGFSAMNNLLHIVIVVRIS
ncbi:Protein RFT1 [Dirofilaria immitis]